MVSSGHLGRREPHTNRADGGARVDWHALLRDEDQTLVRQHAGHRPGDRRQLPTMFGVHRAGRVGRTQGLAAPALLGDPEQLATQPVLQLAAGAERCYGIVKT